MSTEKNTNHPGVHADDMDTGVETACRYSTTKRRQRQVPGNPGAAAPGPVEKKVEQLLQDLKKGKDEIVRSSAAGALDSSKQKKQSNRSSRPSKTAMWYVRDGAAWALGEIKSVKAVGALTEALKDADETTRAKAAEALAKIQGK